MLGSATALKYARRDLPHLDAVLAITPGRTAVVQAGGCLGVYPDHLSKQFETVYCFEPAPDLFRMMTTNAPQDNIVRFQAALGDTRGLVGTSRIRRDGKTNHHEGITHVVEGGTIPTLRIDDLALPVCDLFALDLEGMEFAALRGALDTLARCEPVVLVEINKNLKFVGLTQDDITTFFEFHDYRHHSTLGSDQVFVPCR